MMTRHLSIFVFFFFFSYNTVLGQFCADFYVAAHPDDWQLFMNPHAFHNVKNQDHKVVFLHITSGDDGCGINNNNYYMAREEGSLRGLRFMSNTNSSGAGFGDKMNNRTVIINGHKILKLTYRNIVAYFLRLPDGYLTGTGFRRTGYQSLERLYNGSISSITTIDGSTTYSSLNDLSTTIRTIVEKEAINSHSISLNLADNDTVVNHGDHSDHLFSSRILLDIASDIGDVKVNLFSGYIISSLPQNVFSDDYMVSVGTWGATTSGISDNYHLSTWEPSHNSWLNKQYYRSVFIKKNTTPINLALNKPTSSSSSTPLNKSYNANDGSYSTKNSCWSANLYPQWWQVDLKSYCLINKIIVTTYFDGNRYYWYNIEGSLDGVNWTEVVNYNTNTTPSKSRGTPFDSLFITARYLRVNMNFNSADSGVHLVEFEAYGADFIPIFGGDSIKSNQTTDEVIQFYPNPIKKREYIKINLETFKEDVAFLTVYDCKKKIIKKDTIKVGKDRVINIKTNVLVKGLNIVTIIIGNNVVSKNILIP